MITGFPDEEIRKDGYSYVCGAVAQLGEHLLCKQGVAGSNPVISTRRESRMIPASQTRYDL